MPIQVSLSDGNRVDIDRHPDECPICHHKIAPLQRLAVRLLASYGYVEIVYLCPNEKCHELFIGYFGRPAGGQEQFCQFLWTRPFAPINVQFEDSIKKISPKFCEIYQEAHNAEEYRLTQICGVGYRKALEFLIKDYLISNHSDKAGEIK